MEVIMGVIMGVMMEVTMEVTTEVTMADTTTLTLQTGNASLYLTQLFEVFFSQTPHSAKKPILPISFWLCH